MSFEIETGLHSSEKDHTIMTWGTLKVDKKISSTEPLQIYTYSLDFFPWNTEKDVEFHKWMHTNEHLLWYSKDTGSIRASVNEVDSSFEWKWILDVSPYQLDSGNYGFRVTSLQKIDIKVLQEAVRKSITIALSYLEKVEKWEGDKEGYMGIPFATEWQCGQYDFHNPSEAKKQLLSLDVYDLSIEEKVFETEHKNAVVCDLRFLKPKLENKNDMVLFDPKISYFLSKEIEKKLPEKLPWTVVIIGTFGCMTGMYLCVSCKNGDSIEIWNILKSIIDVVREMDVTNFTDAEKKQIQTVLSNYEQYGK